MRREKTALLEKLDYNVTRPHQGMISEMMPVGLSAAAEALWRDFLTILCFDWNPDFCTWFPFEETRMARVGPPLLLIYFREDITPARHMKPLLCTVATREGALSGKDINAVVYDSSIASQWRQDARIARSNGWDFRIFTEREIHSSYLANAKTFLPYRHSCKMNWEHNDLLSRAMGQLRYCDIETLLTACSDDEATRERLKITLWEMILCGYGIDCDATAPLTQSSPIWDSFNNFSTTTLCPPFADTEKILPGTIVEQQDGMFFITHLWNLDVALGRSLETGRVRKLKIDALTVRTDVSPSHFGDVLYPRCDEDWLEAQRRLAIIRPLLKLPNVSSSNVRALALQEGVTTSAVYRWLRNYGGVGRSYCEGGHILSLVPKGRYKHLSSSIRQIIREVAGAGYFYSSARSLNKTTIEVINQCRSRGEAPPHPSQIRSCIADVCEEFVFLKKGRGEVARSLNVSPLFEARI